MEYISINVDKLTREEIIFKMQTILENYNLKKDELFRIQEKLILELDELSKQYAKHLYMLKEFEG